MENNQLKLYVNFYKILNKNQNLIYIGFLKKIQLIAQLDFMKIYLMNTIQMSLKIISKESTVKAYKQ